MAGILTTLLLACRPRISYTIINAVVHTSTDVPRTVSPAQCFYGADVFPDNLIPGSPDILVPLSVSPVFFVFYL